MAVSLISAYTLSMTHSPIDTAHAVLTESIPLEDLVDPNLGAQRIRDLNLPAIPPGPLRAFLLTDQAGPREIAKRIFRAVSEARRGMFSATLAEQVTILGAPMFPSVPSDNGHYPGPYFEHFLRGLRLRAPQYVLDIQEGAGLPPELEGLVAGVVLVAT